MWLTCRTSPIPALNADSLRCLCNGLSPFLEAFGFVAGFGHRDADAAYRRAVRIDDGRTNSAHRASILRQVDRISALPDAFEFESYLGGGARRGVAEFRQVAAQNLVHLGLAHVRENGEAGCGCVKRAEVADRTEGAHRLRAIRAVDEHHRLGAVRDREMNGLVGELA